MQKKIGNDVQKSTLYIVPTPIGNLQDVTYRALLILRQVNYIVAEDSRRIRILLNFFSIYNKSLYVLNRYNELTVTSKLTEKLKLGFSVALVSNAGTPLISDPGCLLIRSCIKMKIHIVPLPGPCAIITALCGSGLSTDRFCFEGFLPSKPTLRLKRLKCLLDETRTLVFYDVKHRIIDTLQDMVDVFGSERKVVLARELTKIWESIYRASLGELLLYINENNISFKGEITLIVSGNSSKEVQLSSKIFSVMKLLSLELPLKKAIILTSIIYGVKKNLLYKEYINEKLNCVDN